MYSEIRQNLSNSILYSALTDDVEVEGLADLGAGGDLALQPPGVRGTAVLEPQRVVTGSETKTTFKII